MGPYADTSSISGCFPLCQSDRSVISGNTWGKWNESGQQIEMALVILNFVTEFRTYFTFFQISSFRLIIID